MKMMSFECRHDEVDAARTRLKLELGVNIHRIESFGDKFTSCIIFLVPDKETEIIMKLKYPAGTFIDLSA